MIRLVLCDVDGTLVGGESHSVSTRVREAIHRTLEAGIRFGFATGRSPLSLHKIVRDLQLDDTWALCSTGAVIARYSCCVPTGVEIARQHCFAPGEALRTILQEIPDGLVASLQGDCYLTTAPFPPGELSIERPASLEEILNLESTKVVLRWPKKGPEDLLPLLPTLELPEGIKVVMWKEAAWLDLVPTTVSKASAAQELATMVGLDSSEIMAIGDDYNDIDLLRWVGRGVAMGDSPAPVLEAANEVTAPHAEDGVALVLEKLVTNRS